MYKIVSLKENPQLVCDLIDFILPYEENYVLLCERIIACDECIWVCKKNDLIKGVFSYTGNGSFTPFFPHVNIFIISSLLKFFNGKKIFCLIGRKNIANNFKSLCYIVNKSKKSILKDMVTLVYKKNECDSKFDSSSNTFVCSRAEEESLFPLQLNYLTEEMLLPGMKLSPAAERLALAKNINNKNVYATSINDSDGKQIIISKAQTNGKSQNYIQIGGVYTLPSFRSKGFACKTISFLVNEILSQNKTPVLFVNKKNKPAIRCYQKAGFTYSSDFFIEYFI